MPPDQPRVCSGCGAALTLKGKDALDFDTFHGKSWHVACYQERVRAHGDWLRLQKSEPLPDDRAEWDRRRELEEHQRRTGSDRVEVEWPP